MIGINRIILGFPDFDQLDHLRKWERNVSIIDPKIRIEKSRIYISNLDENVQIHCTFYRNKNNGKPRLVISIPSVSKLIYGNNYTCSPDIESLISNLQKKIKLDPLIPIPYDLIDAQLTLIDFFCHYYVGQENMEQYLNQISQAHYPNRKRIIYCNEHKLSSDSMDNIGVVFRAKNVKTRFYDKYLQSTIEKTKGYLRHDIQIMTNKTIGEIMNIEYPTCKNITTEFFETRFDNDLKELRINQPFVNLNIAEEILKRKFGKKGGSHLVDILCYIKKHPNLSIGEMAEDRGIGRGQFVKSIKMITESGISPILNSDEQVLSPLQQFRSLIT
ncbi:MAG: hypothetical protein AB9897_03470 [Anaerolineaceae bacterium]